MEWKQIISTVAPWLGTALGGPLGGLAVSAVADALQLEEKTEQAIQQALGGVTPDQMLAIKQADQQFAGRMQELGFASQQALAKISADDRANARANARAREIATGDKTPRNLAYLLVLGALGTGAGLLFGGLRLDSTLAGVVIGYLFNEASAVTSYYYGEFKQRSSVV